MPLIMLMTNSYMFNVTSPLIVFIHLLLFNRIAFSADLKRAFVPEPLVSDRRLRV